MSADDEIVLAVPGDPVPWAPKQTNKKTGSRFVPARQAAYAGKVIDAWERSAHADGVFAEQGRPMKLYCEFYISRPRTTHYGSGRNERVLKPGAPILPSSKPDGSNLVKMVEDALKGVAFADDDQFTDHASSKRFVHWWEPSRAVVRITIRPYVTVEEYRQLTADEAPRT